MQNKFQRNYRAVFEIGKKLLDGTFIPEEIVHISYPFTLELSVNREIYAQINISNFRFYNISEDVQVKLFKDRFNESKYILMDLYAGYGEDLPLVFRGSFKQCHSYKEQGGVDFYTDIEAWDGGYFAQYGFSNVTLGAQVSAENILKTLVQGQEITVGAITPRSTRSTRPQTFIGQTLKLLQSFDYAEVFIDNGRLCALDENDVLEGDILEIGPESGLLSAPRRSEQYLELQLLFEPRLRIASQIKLNSSLLSFYNQNYKVIGLHHQGVISPVTCATLYTTCNLFLGNTSFNQIKEYAGSDLTSSKTWIKPVNGVITSPFGYRNKPTVGASTFHKGIDYGVPEMTPIKCSNKGKIISAFRDGGYGNAVLVSHGQIDKQTVTSLYGHLNKFCVGSGDIIEQGQVLGYAGQTGVATGPHLHFEIRVNGKAIDPNKFLSEGNNWLL